MPTNTFTITNNVNDGAIASTGGISASQNAIGVESFYHDYLLFKGITIPQNTTINSAYLNIYCTFTSSGVSRPYQNQVGVAIDKNKAAGVPTNLAAITGASVTKKYFRWVVPSWFSPTPQTIASTPDGTMKVVAVASQGNQSSFNLKQHNVKSLVQNLVNATSYSNNNMAFYISSNSDTLNAGYIYARDWGATKAPTLEITYTEPDDNSSSSSSSSSSSESSSSQPPVLIPKTVYIFV